MSDPIGPSAHHLCHHCVHHRLCKVDAAMRDMGRITILQCESFTGYPEADDPRWVPCATCSGQGNFNDKGEPCGKSQWSDPCVFCNGLGLVPPTEQA